MYKVLFFYLGITTSLFANDSLTGVHIFDEYYQMKKSDNDLYQLSRHCFVQKNCEAIDALNAVKAFNEKKIDNRGGKQLGAIICLKLGGKTVIGLSKKSKRLFCYFSDKSVTSISSIENMLRYKKGIN